MTATHLPESSNPRLERLSDQAILNEFGQLVRRDHHHVASLLRHIDIIDRRKLWARQGFPSLFGFLVKRYHMSESTAYKRIGAARTARRFPILFSMVARGEIHLSGIHRIQAHLTPENHERVLAAAIHQTMRQLDELVARLAPQPDVPTTLRALPSRPGPNPTLAAASSALSMPPATATATATAAATAPVESEPPAAIVPAPPTVQTTPASRPPHRDPHPMPLAPGRYKLQLTINQSTRDKLQQLQDLLAHQVPKGELAVIIERAFDALLIQIHRRKTGIAAKPRTPRARADQPRVDQPRVDQPRVDQPRVDQPRVDQPQAHEFVPAGKRTRHLKVSVRRKVWPRDDASCGFVGEDGHRCNATRGLQFAHRQPWAKGGSDTADNIGLRCPAHNALEADRDYGASFMANKRKQKSLKVREPLTRYVVRDVMRAVQPYDGSMRSSGSDDPLGTGRVRLERQR